MRADRVNIPVMYNGEPIGEVSIVAFVASSIAQLQVNGAQHELNLAVRMDDGKAVLCEVGIEANSHA